MPTYTLPNFNLLCNMNICNRDFSSGVPDYIGFPVQKYVNSRDMNAINGFPPWFAEWYRYGLMQIALRFPRIAPFNTAHPYWNIGMFEVPGGSSQFYRTLQNEVMHEGFPNEYALVRVVQCDPFGKFLPPAGAGIATGTNLNDCGD